MKTLITFLLLISTSAFGQGHLEDEFIDCFTSASNTKMTKYKIEPAGSFNANLIYPAEIPMVVEQWEEQNQDDPDFFNSGACLKTEDGTTVSLCGSSKPAKNNLLAVASNNKVIYCEQAISTYVYGVQTPTKPGRR